MNEDELLQRLRAVASEVDGVPDHVNLAAEAALGTRRLDEELAELIADSAEHTPQLVRDASDIRMLSFRAGAVGIEIEIDDRLRGLVTGARGTVTIETPGGTTEAELDERGWFTADIPEAATVRLKITADDGTGVVTSWFTR
ncbi:hypothetical protein FKR81_31560 [Lentzea tibetensis]|uniref:Uncharacterized protein n=1 Tax=Lentzea tibetensis TaxID=2591470 RepID=A0A563EKL0_9PSEU|nr:hypothetical protein [Lentzea tibetensis]TWP47503.1 hypothetical protein FKR81_31560 [Lentzea tibetensis]